MLPDAAKNELEEALNETASNTGLNLIMALKLQQPLGNCKCG